MYNYCTHSYTAAFWGEKEWGEELDLMALQGVNRALVSAGMGKVWELTLRDLGYPEEKIKEFIPNPSADAWWNMGNLEGHSGPLTQGIIDREAKLGKFIVNRMRELGMEPILPGFVGLVPSEFSKYVELEGARYVPQGTWVDKKFVRPWVLDQTCPAFAKVADVYYKNLKKVYGMAPKFFGGDLFHEGGTAKGIDVAEAALSVQNKMQEASPGSTWALQAWSGNPTENFLKKIDKDKLIVFALEGNGNLEAWKSAGKGFKPFHGTPWVWGELQNFGGRQNLWGPMDKMFMFGDLPDSPGKDQLKGWGSFSEGTETNPMYYELFFQRFWLPKNKSFNQEEQQEWTKRYALNRYGAAPDELLSGLNKLRTSLYSPMRSSGGSTENILCGRPSRYKERVSTWAPGGITYNPLIPIEAANDLLKAAEKYPELLKQETFRFDLMDISRHISGDIARPLLEATLRAYDRKDLKEFDRLSGAYLDLMLKTDAVMGTVKESRFGEMYERALAKGDTPEEKKLMGTACKRLVTTWSGQYDQLNDYAHRQLQGLMKDYYMPRWAAFFKAHRQALTGEIKPEEVNAYYVKGLAPNEFGWEHEDTAYSSKPEGDTLVAAKALIDTFTPIIRQYANLIKEETGELWTISDGKSMLEFNVSDLIVEEGDYTVTFHYQAGNNALEIESVELYEGPTLVSKDEHYGKTGVEGKDNTYRLNVPKLRTNLDSYVIKAKVKGLGGNDSSGKMIVRKVAAKA